MDKTGDPKLTRSILSFVYKLSRAGDNI